MAKCPHRSKHSSACRVSDSTARVRERPVWFTSSWGATETSPAITSVHWPIERAGCIGAPLPGIELKFVPNAGKLEMRVRGPTVFPGYRNAPELTAYLPGLVLSVLIRRLGAVPDKVLARDMLFR